MVAFEYHETKRGLGNILDNIYQSARLWILSAAVLIISGECVS